MVKKYVYRKVENGKCPFPDPKKDGFGIKYKKSDSKYFPTYKQKGFSRSSWFGRTGLPVRCRDIIERLSIKRYICPHEVITLIARLAIKWNVSFHYLQQHAFSCQNGKASDYLKSGIPLYYNTSGDHTKGCVRCGRKIGGDIFDLEMAIIRNEERNQEEKEAKEEEERINHKP